MHYSIPLRKYLPVYKIIIRPILFLFPPEFIHLITAKILKIGSVFGILNLTKGLYTVNNENLERKIFGLTFANPVGLAAGFDKDAKMIDELATFGFSFIEIGTLTPVGQPGNPKPRLFRLKQDSALINRMGFNNDGVEKSISRLKKRKSKVIVGGNIGKNKVTPNDQAFSDYEKCFNALFPYVDYFVINISSPNTPGLRELQEKEPLKKLITHIQKIALDKPVKKPLLLKIAPDLTNSQLDDIIEIIQETALDGVIATNTTISRDKLLTDQKTVEEIGAGGLSGLPVLLKSNEIIAYLRKNLGPGTPIIGVGGIMTPDQAVEKLKAGADLIQIYTGFVYNGPAFIKNINRAILREFKYI